MTSPHAATVAPPPPSTPTRRLAAALVGFSTSVIDNDLALANAQEAARGFYRDLVKAEARIAELEAENARLCVGR